MTYYVRLNTPGVVLIGQTKNYEGANILIKSIFVTQFENFNLTTFPLCTNE